MSFGSNHRAWDAIDTYVRACGGDPRAGNLDAILARREVVSVIDEHCEEETEDLEKALADAIAGPHDEDLISLPTPSPLATVEQVPA